ncbi:hypothetical protein GALL_264830 [mine drainage metagenome]|uniref:General secretion pathway protein N n=1 Tax=mine drainage metagenome TaxID=410659 RepID=A0A1J5R6L0_9ZZZZ
MARRRHPRQPSSASARWPFWLAGLLGLLWVIVAEAPASWLGAAVAAASQQRVLLAQTQGTWRDGSARVVLAGGPQSRGATLAPGVLHWRIGLTGLWHGRIRLGLRWPGLAETPLQLAVQAHIGGWTLRQVQPPDWQALVPAALLEGLGTPWNTLALRGGIALAFHNASLESAAGRLRLMGAVQVKASDMSSRLSTVAPLGSYLLRVHGDGAKADMQLSTLSGPLILAGKGVWNGQQLQFAGTAQAAAGQEEALANLLSLLGQREGDKVRIGL